MGLDKPSTLLPVDIFRSIYECKTKLSNYSIPKHLPSSEQGKEIVLCALMSSENENSLSLRLELKDNGQSLEQGKEIVLRALSFENEISLFLWLEPKDNGQSVILGKLGTYRIGEDMQKFLHSSFSRLCIYTFLGVTQENINAVLKFNPETIGESSFEKAFDILFIAICYSGLIKQDNGNRYLKDKMKELTSEMLREIGKAAAQSLIISLASMRNQIRSEYKNLEMDGLTISYSSVISKSISCYCTRLEMDEKFALKDANNNFEDKLNHQLFYCELGFDSAVKNNGDRIEVKHTIRFLHFNPIQLNSSTNSKERHFPAKISIQIWPEGDVDFINLLMGESTPDPSATVTNTTSRESSFGAQVGTAAASLTLRCNCSRSTAHTLTRSCWKRKRDIEDSVVGKQAWILEDRLSGVSAFDYEPCCCRGAAEDKALVGVLTGPDRPFTESGGIIFEGEEMCGPPMTWEFKRPPLKWAVEVEIGVAYYGRQYIEVRSKKFGGISLVQPIEDSIQQPTLSPLVNNPPRQRTSAQHVRRTAPRPNQQQVPPVTNSPPQSAPSTSAPHTTEQQVPLLMWVFVISILICFCNRLFK